MGEFITPVDERPWGVTGLTTQKWMDTIPLSRVPMRMVVPTQRHIDLWALVTVPPTQDPFPHIVLWRGRLYLEDGHHRYARAAVRGEETLLARVFYAG